MNRPATAADPAELAAFLAANTGIEFLDIHYTNLAGVPRGKRLRAHEFVAAFESGRYLPGSILVVDITGMDVEESGLVWEDGDADRLAWPVPGTLARAPWLGPDSAEVMLSMHELNGKPCDLDPRQILRNVLARFTADGLTPVVACELEFYLVDGRRARDGTIRLPRHASAHRQVYGLDSADIDNDYLRDLWRACDALGLPTGAAISEYAPGQYEITLAHKADALAAADDAVRFKRAAKGVADTHRRTATFMAKPFADLSGSGLHIHVSVLDKKGRNIFASTDPHGTPARDSALGHAIGGAANLMPAGIAVFAPNANSYRRFRPNSYAPVRAGWGVNNRTVPLRIPAGPPASRHIEHRLSGADAQPHLAVATVLAGIHHGLTHAIDPGPPVTGDGQTTGERLPTDWPHALSLFEDSRLLTEYWGGRGTELYATMKRVEAERYNAIITPLDYDWVLRSA